MKPFFILLALMAMSVCICAQDEVLDQQLLPVVDKMPFFVGDEEAMNRFIDERIFYPWAGDSVQGQVTCRFVVSKFGDLEDLEVVQSLNPLADSIAVSILRNMPRWIPAILNGMPITYPMELSIGFDPEKIPAERKLSKSATKPNFPGGARTLSNYILRNLDSEDIWPQEDPSKRIMLQFVIDREGKIHHPHILKSVDPKLETKLLYIVNQMPDWIVPEGDSGCYLYTLPLNIRVQ